MTSVLTINLLRALFVAFTAYIGATVGGELYQATLPGTVLGLVFGLVLVLADLLLKGVTLRAFSSATFGLALGLIFATLLRWSDLLKFQSPEMEWAVALVVYVTFGYLGMMLAIRSNREEFSIIIPYVRFSRQADLDPPVLVDTNILIDGRILNLATTGFLSPFLIVPAFVLSELQRLADSSDSLRRERGRRGLDNLNLLRNMDEVEVTFPDGGGTEQDPVDSRLLALARRTGARILTNDMNLCKVARLHHVRVLNLNDLVDAVRPSLNPGDSLKLPLVKEGKDEHQAVGYLENGTMIVVNNGREAIGKTVNVKITGTVQTAAGRLVFAEPTQDGE